MCRYRFEDKTVTEINCYTPNTAMDQRLNRLYTKKQSDPGMLNVRPFEFYPAFGVLQKTIKLA